ncbi:MAG: TolB family protein [Planctomycetota bacterium]
MFYKSVNGNSKLKQLGIIAASLVCLSMVVRVGTAEPTGPVIEMMGEIRGRLFAGQVEAKAAQRRLEEAGIELGLWYRIGPFRDQGPMINWMDNVASGFAFEFEVERDVKANRGFALLDKIYRAANFPATPEAVRKWTKHPEWIDGYYQELPRGPAPSAGESQYVYKTITVDKAVAVDIDFIIRAPESDRRLGELGMEHWRRTGRYVWWVNGKEIQRWEGHGDMPPRVTVELVKGINNFLAKVTNNRHAYGFSFAVYGLHPTPRREPGFEQCWRPLVVNPTTELPFFREKNEDYPDWIIKRGDWKETLFASLENLRRLEQESEVQIASFDGEKFPVGWTAQGNGFGEAPRSGRSDLYAAGSWTKDGQQKLTGKLLSPPFTVNKPFLMFNIAGGINHKTTDLRLLVQKKDGSYKVAASFRDYRNENFAWENLDVSAWQGRLGRIEVVDSEYEDEWGWIALREVRLCDKPSLFARQQREWYSLRGLALTAHQQQQLELVIQSLGNEYGDLIKASNPRDMETLLKLKIAAKLENLIGSDCGKLLEIDDFSRFIRSATDLLVYHDSLKRLLALRFYPLAMPGIEHAAKDSKGHIVPAFEKSLEKYPTSREGDRHTARLEKLERIVEPLLDKLETADEPMYVKVLSAAEAVDEMWEQTISELPPLLFLERITYGHDTLQFTRSGRLNALIRSFDPKRRSLKTIFKNSQGKSHEINLSWDGKTIFIGGGGNVQAVDAKGNDYRVISTGQSPCEMPDGRLVFFDDDAGQSPCKSDGPRRLLFICDPDGNNRKLVSANLTIDNTPTITNDGRVIFARWDYGVNKNVFNRHAIWVQNPDGTGMDLYFGNTVIDPRGFYRPRQIPGRPEMLCVFGPHHNNVAGLIGLLWNGNGREAPDGISCIGGRQCSGVCIPGSMAP